MEKVYVCSQYATRGDRATNLEFAKLFCMAVIEEGKIPICPHLFYGGVLNEDVESQRAAGLRMGLELLKDCSELRVFSRLSEGMKAEIKVAEAAGIQVAVADMSVIYSEDQASAYAKEIIEDLEVLRRGKKYHSEAH